MEDTMEKAKKILSTVVPSFVVSFLISLVLFLVLLLDGIKTRLVSGETLAYEISGQDIQALMFAYLDKSLVNSIFTVIFWAIAAIIGLFIAWVVRSTYITISNILIIELEFSNKPKSFIKKAAIEVAGKAIVTVLLIFWVLLVVKLLVPLFVARSGAQLLASTQTIASFGLAFVWFLSLVALLTVTWQIITFAIRFLRTKV